MEFLYEIGLFTLKTLVIVVGIVVAAAFLFQVGSSRGRKPTQIEVEKLNNRFRSFRRHLQGHLLGKKQYKSLMKNEKKELKKEAAGAARPGRIFVLDFHGDIRATAASSLREEVTAVLSVAQPDDEVVVRLESGGGLVTAYGLAASQLARLREAKVKLTVCVDKIAASGGYMMACVADRILAAPFAVVGSIGVIAQVPNFHRILKKNDVDYREVTAGEFKRTVTVFGEITEPGFEKFKEQIEGTHTLFKSFVASNRPKVDIDRVATGEHWYGTQALELGLIDEIMTSDDYLFRRYTSSDVFKIKYQGRKRFMERFSESAADAAHRLLARLWSDADRTRYGL